MGEWGHVMRDMVRDLKILSKGIIAKTAIPPLLKCIRMDGEDAFISATFPFYFLPRVIKGVSQGSVGRGKKDAIIITIFKIIKQYPMFLFKGPEKFLIWR